MGVGICSSKPS